MEDLAIKSTEKRRDNFHNLLQCNINLSQKISALTQKIHTTLLYGPWQNPYNERVENPLNGDVRPCVSRSKHEASNKDICDSGHDGL